MLADKDFSKDGKVDGEGASDITIPSVFNRIQLGLKANDVKDVTKVRDLDIVTMEDASEDGDGCETEGSGGLGLGELQIPKPQTRFTVRPVGSTMSDFSLVHGTVEKSTLVGEGSLGKNIVGKDTGEVVMEKERSDMKFTKAESVDRENGSTTSILHQKRVYLAGQTGGQKAIKGSVNESDMSNKQAKQVVESDYEAVVKKDQIKDVWGAVKDYKLDKQKVEIVGEDTKHLSTKQEPESQLPSNISTPLCLNNAQYTPPKDEEVYLAKCLAQVSSMLFLKEISPPTSHLGVSTVGFKSQIDTANMDVFAGQSEGVFLTPSWADLVEEDNEESYTVDEEIVDDLNVIDDSQGDEHETLREGMFPFAANFKVTKVFPLGPANMPLSDIETGNTKDAVDSEFDIDPIIFNETT